MVADNIQLFTQWSQLGTYILLCSLFYYFVNSVGTIQLRHNFTCYVSHFDYRFFISSFASIVIGTLILNYGEHLAIVQFHNGSIIVARDFAIRLQHLNTLSLH